MKNILLCFSLLFLIIIEGCNSGSNTIELKGEMLSDVVLIGVIEKNKSAVIGDPTSYHLNLSNQLTINNVDAQLCDKKSKISEIEIYYNGDNAFDGIDGKQVSLVGKIDCPRGGFVFRDINFDIKDGPSLKEVMDKNAKKAEIALTLKEKDEAQAEIIRNKKWYIYSGKCEQAFSLGEHMKRLDSVGKKYSVLNIQEKFGIPVVVDFTSDVAPIGAVFQQVITMRFYKGEELCLEDAQKIEANAKNNKNIKQREASKYN